MRQRAPLACAARARPGDTQWMPTIGSAVSLAFFFFFFFFTGLERLASGEPSTSSSSAASSSSFSGTAAEKGSANTIVFGAEGTSELSFGHQSLPPVATSVAESFIASLHKLRPAWLDRTDWHLPSSTRHTRAVVSSPQLTAVVPSRLQHKSHTRAL